MKIMTWNVWRHNINSGLMEMWNIFNHYSFKKDVDDALGTYSDKDEFTKYLQTTLMYYFWCKSEYEIIISPWCRSKGDMEKKIDIYMQVMANWDKFVDYVWNLQKGEVYE